MTLISRLVASLALSTFIAACGDGHGHDHGHPHPDDGEDGSAATPAADTGHGHEHAEEPLGSITLGDLAVELAQGHGAVAAGKEAHLVVKLPYSDSGSTTVRAWIGSEDRTLSYVGKGQYDPGQDDYDVHATAPDPLPVGAQWWIELERPDGTRVVGSAPPLVD